MISAESNEVLPLCSKPVELREPRDPESNIIDMLIRQKKETSRIRI